MKQFFSIVFLQTLLVIQVISQIGINMDTPLQLLHIDPAGNTVNNTNMSDDIVVTSEGKVGIGTIFPHKELTVNGNFAVGILNSGMGEGNRLYLRGNDDNSDPIWIARYNESNDVTHIRFNIGDDPYNELGQKDRMVIGTTLPGVETFKPIYVIQSDGNVGLNVADPKYTLDIDGGVFAEEGIIVPIGRGADYIFDKEYQLTPLSKLHSNSYSAEEAMGYLNNNGEFSLDTISIFCLKKIEELVLYKIQLDNMLNSLNAELEKQEKILSDFIGVDK